MNKRTREQENKRTKEQKNREPVNKRTRTRRATSILTNNKITSKNYMNKFES